MRILLTGGIGSGKSTICKYFLWFGIPVFDSDSNAKSHYKNLHKELIEIFGADVIKNGEVDKSKMLVIFSDRNKLRQLQDIVHPLVLNDFDDFCKQDASYHIFESALPSDGFDKTISVVADKEVRIERVINRNGISREDVLMRMKFQQPEYYYEAIGDFVIRNNPNDDIISQINKIREKINPH